MNLKSNLKRVVTALRPSNIKYRLRGGHLMAGAWADQTVTVNQYGDRVHDTNVVAWLDRPENADYVSPPVPEADFKLAAALDRVSFGLGAVLCIMTGILVGAGITS